MNPTPSLSPFPTPAIAATTAAPPLVRFTGLTKSYDGRSVIVRDLDLDIRKGEFLTLLGPSGSGKTTCLMMLAGFEPWTTGDILFEGRSLDGVPSHKRGIGVVFQNYALFPHMTIADNVGFPLRQRGVPKAERRAQALAALRMVELDNLADRLPAQLSGGQQQRVALARALVFNPVLMLMDEPLGALDKRLREQMQIEIKHLHEKIGMTVVYVTHDQSEALTMSDRIAIFNKGRIEQIGTPQDIYERPMTSFVANFVGENNLVPASVVTTTGEDCTVRLGDGSELAAVAARPVSAGASVQLSIRPELIRLAPEDGAIVNRVAVILKEQIYFGDHAMLRCEMADGSGLIARVPLSAARKLDVGVPLTLGWNVEDGRILAE